MDGWDVMGDTSSIVAEEKGLLLDSANGIKEVGQVFENMDTANHLILEFDGKINSYTSGPGNPDLAFFRG